MAIFLWILLGSLLASVVVIAATAVVYFGATGTAATSPLLLSFAVGTLLSSAFIGLLPAALRPGNHVAILGTTLAGMLLFFALERSLIWRHCHMPECAIHGAPGTLIVIGDAFHNFVDGIVIATAFLTSVPTGLSATFAVMAHEVPQEIGDFAILTSSGYTRRRAILLNLASSATTPVGASAAYLLFSEVNQFIPYVLAISASSFIYVGTADLIPSLHRVSRPGTAFAQSMCLLSGVSIIAVLTPGLFY